MAPNMPTKSAPALNRGVSTVRRTSIATAGAATSSPKAAASRYSARGSVTPSSRRSEMAPSSRLGMSRTVSPTFEPLRMRRSVAGRCAAIRNRSAEPGSSPPTQAVPSLTRTPSGVSIQVMARRRSGPTSSTGPTKTCTGSPSVVALTKCSERPPRLRHPSPNRASSSGENCSKWMFPATVPPRNPKVWAVLSSWIEPFAPREKFTGLRTGPASTPSRSSTLNVAVIVGSSLDRP